LLSDILEKEKQLKRIMSDRIYRPIERQWNDMLATKGIEFQQSYTIQLGGDHIYRFMNHCEEILSMTLILENILKSKTNQT